MDKVDQNIIMELLEDSSQSHRVIGEKIFLSSQAISQRVKKLESSGVILKYNVDINVSDIIYIEVYMNDIKFSEFENVIKEEMYVLSLEKIEGAFCYLIKYWKNDEIIYSKFLETLERYGRYKINKVFKKII